MSNLRRYREAAGFTQAELAERAGVSRQLIGAAEAGRNLPRVDSGLALAGALGIEVEVLFADHASAIDVLTGATPADGTLVRSGRVGEQIVVAPLHHAPEGWGTVDGEIRDGGYLPWSQARDGFVVAGCEPGLEVLERLLRQSGAGAVSVTASSTAAIEALRNDRVHAAVVHGPALGRAGEIDDVVRIRLANWEVGLADAYDAEGGWFEQALTGRVPVVQREQGAGVQAEFESRVESADPVPGPRATSHLEAASRAVYGGLPAVTIEPAALAVGAEFRALGLHETQLWIAAQWRNERAVIEALDVIADRRYQARLRAVGGYDLSGFGTRLA